MRDSVTEIKQSFRQYDKVEPQGGGTEWRNGTGCPGDGWLDGGTYCQGSLATVHVAGNRYSPTCCSYLLHQATGMTLRSYIAAVRIQRAVQAVRDTDERLLDISIGCGYVSHEALTDSLCKTVRTIAECLPEASGSPSSGTAFVGKPSCRIRKWRYGYEQSSGGERSSLVYPFASVHRSIGIWDTDDRNYGEFWNNRDCEEISDLVENLRPISHDIVGPGKRIR